MMVKLPAKRSRDIQRRHVRRVMTSKGPKDVLVNPSVRRPLKPHSSFGSSVKPSGGVSVPVVPKRLVRRVRWDSILKVDDGTNIPISVPYVAPRLTVEDLYERLDIFPDRNEDAFTNMIRESLAELYARVDNLEIRGLSEFEKAVDKIVKDLNDVLYDDEYQPPVQVSYSQPTDDEDNDYGFISRYKEYNVKGLDYKWVDTGGYRGYFDLVVDPDGPWEEVHSDVFLWGSEDSKNLDAFNKSLTSELEFRGIDWAHATLSTSNVLSANTVMLVSKGRGLEVQALIESLNKVYRRDEDFMREANPFTQGVGESVAAGRSRAELVAIADTTSDPEVRAMLLRAIDSALGGGRS